MLHSMCKIALFSFVALGLVSVPAFGQNQFNPNGNPVMAANIGPAQTNAAQNTAQNSANAGANTQQSSLTPEQLQQQIQAEMTRMAKDMIASFDQNGDKALNEKELQEALVALTNMMRSSNQHQGSATGVSSNSSNNSANNTATSSNLSNRQAFNRAGANSTGPANPNANNATSNGDPTNTGTTSQRIRRRR